MTYFRMLYIMFCINVIYNENNEIPTEFLTVYQSSQFIYSLYRKIKHFMSVKTGRLSYFTHFRSVSKQYPKPDLAV